MKTFLHLAVPAITFLLLLAVGLDLTPTDFSRVRRQPRVLAVGLLGPVLVLPPLALLLVAVLRPSPDPVDRGERPAVFVHGLRHTVPLAATFVVTSFLAGWLSGAASGASSSDVFTLATEFATRNMAVATAIALTMAERIEFALFATTYFLTEIPLMLCAIVVYRRSRQPPSS